jgi:putative transposase
MLFADSPSILPLFQQIVTTGWLQFLQKQSVVKFRRGVYSVRVVLWLMMLQRLHAGATLSTAVQLLIQGAAAPLLERCHRVQRGKVSSRTGAYCQARQKLPKLLCREVSQQIFERLMQVLGEDPGAPRVFVLDGSSLELEHSTELVRSYPPATNQFGRSHWPVLRIVVAHELETGLAVAPCWGPMYGAQAVSEQELADKLMGQVPETSTILADRNFGVFWMAYMAQQRGLRVLLRLTEERARKLVPAISQPGEYAVVWHASRFDGGKTRSFPSDCSVSGRLIAARIGRGKSQQWLYLFTTLDLPWQENVEFYRRRADIETDLRALKRTVNLHHIHAKSQDMLEKELLIAMSAYNFVRAVMCMAARHSGRKTRQISFSGVLTVVNCAWSKLVAAADDSDPDAFLRVVELASQCTLPKRTKPRSYPRERWRRSAGFPFRKPEAI